MNQVIEKLTNPAGLAFILFCVAGLFALISFLEALACKRLHGLIEELITRIDQLGDSYEHSINSLDISNDLLAKALHVSPNLPAEINQGNANEN